MERHTIKINSIEKITLDVLQIITDKPENFHFKPGQACEISINKPEWKNEKRPFTFTSIPIDNFLEFTIKTYPSHGGVTNELLKLKTEDELILHEVFGSIAYQQEGVFIAGGAGITPFISIFRELDYSEISTSNKLIFANKTRADIILEKELSEILGDNFINILSEEELKGYDHGIITEKYLSSKCDVENQTFYLCGPPKMMKSVEEILDSLGVKSSNIIKENF